MDLTPDQLKQMISMLQVMLAAQGGQEQKEEEDNFESPIKTKKTKLPKNKVRENKFDKMSERNLHKEDSEIDKKLCVQPPVTRGRNPSLINVSCRVCGKKEEVSAGLVGDKERYKCNKCSISAG